MKHLHLNFILASFSIGLGVAFLLGAFWNVHDLPLTGTIPWSVMWMAWYSAAAGLVLVSFGYQGVRQEMYGRR